MVSSFFLFSPLFGEDLPIWRWYFSEGLVQPPPSGDLVRESPLPKCSKYFRHREFTLPETNIFFAPENGWLEYKPFLLGWPIFRGENVSFREGRSFSSLFARNLCRIFPPKMDRMPSSHRYRKAMCLRCGGQKFGLFVLRSGSGS